MLWNSLTFGSFFRCFDCNMNFFRFQIIFFINFTLHRISDKFETTHMKLFNFSSLYFCFANQPKHFSLLLFIYRLIKSSFSQLLVSFKIICWVVLDIRDLLKRVITFIFMRHQISIRFDNSSLRLFNCLFKLT